jgi:hypothetical protein
MGNAKAAAPIPPARDGMIDAQGALALQGLAGNVAARHAVMRARGEAAAGGARPGQGAAAVDVAALIRSTAPALISVLSLDQIQELQHRYAVRAANAAVERRYQATWAAWYNRYNLDPMGIGQARRQLERIAEGMQVDPKGPIQVQIPTNLVLSPSVIAKPDWNVQAEQEFRTWVLGRLRSQPLSVRLQDIGTSPSLDYYVGDQYVPHTAGAITFDDVLKVPEFNSRYIEQVRNGPQIIEARKAIIQLIDGIIEALADHKDLSRRNREHKIVRKLSEWVGGPGVGDIVRAIEDAKLHPEKGSVEERMRQVRAPYPSIHQWEQPRTHADRAQTLLNEGKYELAVAVYAMAQHEAVAAGEELARYEKKVFGGAGKIVGALEVLKTAGTLAVGVASAGAGLGLAATGALAAGYSMTRETAQQASEVHFGLREHMDIRAAAGKAAVEGALALLGGGAQKAFVEAITLRVGARLTAAFGKSIAEAAISSAGAGIAQFYVAPAGIVLKSVANGEAMPKNLEELCDLIAAEATKGAAMDLLLRPLNTAAAGHGATEPPQPDNPIADALAPGAAKAGREEPAPAKSKEERPGETLPEPTSAGHAPSEVLALPGAAAGARPSAEATAPAGGDHGIPEPWMEGMQQVANQLDVVIRLRPMNPAAAKALEGGAVPKMSLVEAKTINELDLLIGAPKEGEGLVGIFEPHDPPRGLDPALRRRALERKAKRAAEYRRLLPEYQALEKSGLMRIEGSLVKVFDPRTGEFKAVAGDVDIMGITNADGSPLTPDQQDFVTGLLRSQGIGVEHGAQEWWQRQSPDSYSAAKDAGLRAESSRESAKPENKLVAIVPGQEPRRVWVDEAVTAPPRAVGPGEKPMPLAGAKVVAEPGPVEGRTEELGISRYRFGDDPLPTGRDVFFHGSRDVAGLVSAGGFRLTEARVKVWSSKDSDMATGYARDGLIAFRVPKDWIDAIDRARASGRTYCDGAGWTYDGYAGEGEAILTFTSQEALRRVEILGAWMRRRDAK